VKRMFAMLVGSALITLVGTMAARAGEVQALRELPPLLRAVSDEPGVLSLGEGQALSRRIAEIERDIGVKMIVLVVVTVAPESIDAFVQRLVNHWKRRGCALDNGRFVFIVIAKHERELRIVPGPELAWVLELLAGKEIAETVSGLLRGNQYYDALLTMVNTIERLIADRRRTVRRDDVHHRSTHGLQIGKHPTWRVKTV